MLLDPLRDRLIRSQGQIEIIAIVRHQGEADQRAAHAIIFGIDEVSQRQAPGVQSSVGSGRPLRQRFCASR